MLRLGYLRFKLHGTYRYDAISLHGLGGIVL